MSSLKAEEEITMACDLTVFTEEQREQHLADVARLFASVSEVREFEEGYALRLPDEEGMLALIADFIRDESRCCPFFHFNLEVEPYRKAIWLKIGGGEVIKAFVVAEIADLLPDQVAVGLR